MLIFLAFYFGCGYADAQSVKRTGNTFEITSSAKQKQESQATVYWFKEADGTMHTIYLSTNGRAYIIKTSGKTGKEYKKYLPEETSREICREMGREYKEKSNK